MLITAIAVMFGGTALVAPAANADTTVTYESVSYSNGAASANVTSEVRALINGATQLTWWYPNHNIKVTKAAVKKAPRIKVKYTRCSVQSKSIAKQAHGATLVVAKPGSEICNTGKNGHIVGGFKWVVKTPAVLKWNKRLKLYQHVYNIVGGKLVKTCGNRMGGPIDTMYPQVVQVQYESDVLLDINLGADASVKAKVEASLQCPSGTLYGSAEATASATASASIRVKSGVKVTAINAKKVELLNKVQASARASAEASAKAKISLTCSDNPPPPVYEAPGVDVTPVACVEPGQDRDVTVTVSNPNGIADTAKVTYRGQVYTKSVAAHGQVTFTFANQAAGTYSGTALLVNADKSKSFTVTVEECDVPPPVDHKPVVNIMGSPAHLYVGGNAYVWIEAFDPDGDAVSVQVSASGAGTVAGLVPVDIRWDGTPCPSGKACFRATAWAGSTPGDMTITVKVTANGVSGDPDAVTFPVKADEF